MLSAAGVMLSAAKHLAPAARGLVLTRGQTLRFAQSDNPSHGVEYCDRTVSMSEAARRAVEKLRTETRK